MVGSSLRAFASAVSARHASDRLDRRGSRRRPTRRPCRHRFEQSPSTPASSYASCRSHTPNNFVQCFHACIIGGNGMALSPCRPRAGRPSTDTPISPRRSVAFLPIQAGDPRLRAYRCLMPPSQSETVDLVGTGYEGVTFPFHESLQRTKGGPDQNALSSVHGTGAVEKTILGKYSRSGDLRRRPLYLIPAVLRATASAGARPDGSRIRVRTAEAPMCHAAATSNQLPSNSSRKWVNHHFATASWTAGSRMSPTTRACCIRNGMDPCGASWMSGS